VGSRIPFPVIALCAWLLTFFGMAACLLHLSLLAARSLQPDRGTVVSQREPAFEVTPFR
jgi:hypothetical protein